MKTPRVSVLLPVYNAGKTLRPAVDSVLRQDFADFELILLDDGSRDGSHEIIRDYARNDSRVKPHLHSENAGLIQRLNQGLELCQGELVARMDSDDECLPHRLRVQVGLMASQPDVAVCGSWALQMGATPERDRLVRLPYTRKQIRETLERENCLYHPTVILRKSIIRELGGYSPHFPHAEDYELWLRVSRRHAVVNIPEPLLRYRLSHGGVTFTKRWDLLGSVLLAQERHREPERTLEVARAAATARLQEIPRAEFFTNVISSAIEDLLALGQPADALKLIELSANEIGPKMTDALRKVICQ
jgi:glycosyltransferase involved in cell wall biosynthesis